MANPPIYRESGRALSIDTCAPQRKAMAEGKCRIVSLGRGTYPGRRLRAQDVPGISGVGYMHIEGNQDWGTDAHRNEGVEVAFLESGTMPFLVEDQPHLLQSNDLTITRPWQVHRLGDPFVASSRLHWVIFDVGVRRPNQTWQWPEWVHLARRDLAEITDALRHMEAPVLSANRDIRRCFRRIARLVEHHRRGSHTSHLAVYLNELLLLLLELLRGSRPSLDRRLSGRRHTVDLFVRDLARNPESLREQWTVAAMAEQCGLSASTFKRYCRDLTNMTPMNYLTRCRVEAAAQRLLDDPAVSVTDVAFQVGFNSSQYFATVFRRHMHCSPRSFRTGPVAGFTGLAP